MPLPRFAIDARTFDPRSIPDCACWFDFSDSTTLAQNSDGTGSVTANGDPVGYVRSKVGSITGTQTTSSLRPTWLANWRAGRPSIAMANVNQTGFALSANPFGSAATLIYAGQATSGTVWVTYFSQPNSGVYCDVFQSGNSGSPSSNMGTPSYRINRSAVTATRATLYSTVTNNAYLLTVTGIALASATSPAIFSYPGASMTGRCGEWITYSRALSTAEITAVENYLAKKWAL
jgi:hypothetical protein